MLGGEENDVILCTLLMAQEPKFKPDSEFGLIVCEPYELDDEIRQPKPEILQLMSVYGSQIEIEQTRLFLIRQDFTDRVVESQHY